MRFAVLSKRLFMLLAVGGTAACTASKLEAAPPGVEDSSPLESAQACAGTTVFETTAPTTQARHRDPNFWIGAAASDPDTVMMSRQQIAATNAKYADDGELFRDPLQLSASDDPAIRARWEHRGAWMRQKIEEGSYVEQTPGAMTRALDRIDRARLYTELRVITAESALWCVPTTDGILSQARDVAFDRNRCTGLHPGELVLATHAVEGEAWVHVEAGHSSGWLREPQWTPPLSREAASEFTSQRPRGYVVREGASDDRGAPVRIGTSFPLRGEVTDVATVLLPDATGLRAQPLNGALFSQGPVPLTRRRLLELAFSRMGDAYGWGGYKGNRDCSRFLHDVLAAFGILMARNSAAQSLMGADHINLEGMTDAEKRAEIDRLNASNVVLLYMPGHIMLYLGRDGERRFALSSLSEYLRPCEGGGAQTVRLDRVEVTPLELGRGTSRTSFIERMTTAIVFGPG